MTKTRWTMVNIFTVLLLASCGNNNPKTRTTEPAPKLPPQVKGNVKKPSPLITTTKRFEGNLAKLYKCMITNAYEYMFCKRATSCDRARKWSYRGKNSGITKLDRLGVFTAGTSGFWNYADMGKCLLASAGRASKKTWWSLKALEKISGIKGTKGKLLGYAKRYNKAIITWAADNLIPNPDDPFMGSTYRRVYHATLFRVARLFAKVFIFLNPTLRSEAMAYKQFVLSHPKKSAIKYLKTHFESSTENFYPLPENGTNLTGFHVAGIWLRRYLDGTEPALRKALGKLLRRYDPKFVQANQSHMHLFN